MTPLEEELQILEVKLRQLGVDYEHYFLGRQPREPIALRSDVQKQFARYAATPIRNTAARFRFNSLNGRFQAMKRQWDLVLRQIEAGTYKRHVFKAKLHEEARTRASPDPEATAPRRLEGLYDSYLEAARACGQNVDKLTPERLQAAIGRQEAALKSRLGCDHVDFRVVVSDGKVKLKASARRD